MTDTPAVQGQIAAQDTTQVLQRIFTGHIVGQPAMPGNLSAKVVTSTNTTVTVTIDGFDSASGQPTPSFTCYYEPRHHWSGSANVQASPPPKGTPCLVTFPTNDPQGYGWAIAFTGWPTM